MEILIHDNYALVQDIPTKFISYFYELYFIFCEFLKSKNGQVLIKFGIPFSSSPDLHQHHAGHARTSTQVPGKWPQQLECLEELQ
jgi:hypothetical protein